MDVLRELPELMSLSLGHASDDRRVVQEVEMPNLVHLRIDVLTPELVEAIVTSPLPALRCLHIAGRVASKVRLRFA